MRTTVALLVALAALSGCSEVKKRLGMDKCTPAHQLGEPSTDLEVLSRLVMMETRPVRATWARGQVGGPSEGANLPGGGDWELVAVLEFADADANKLTDSGRGEVREVELPGAAWIARELGVPPPAGPKAGECTSPMMRVSGFGYDAAPFTQYFLKPVALIKVPESALFILWLSTRPPEVDAKERTR